MKHGLLLAAAMMALSFSACQKSDSAPDPIPGDSDQSLQIALSTGGTTSTRAGRPLLSEERGQDIQNITLYFVNESSQIALIKHIAKGEWSNATDYADGKQLELSLKKSNDEELPDGNYTVYAVGYSDASDYDFNLSLDSKNVTECTSSATTFNKTDFYASLQSGKYDAEEVFAGSSAIVAKVIGSGNDAKKVLLPADNAESTTKVIPAVILNRQVAGVTGYFTNIPVAVGGATPTALRLVSVAKNTRVNFFPLENGYSTVEQTLKYVVNGSEQSTEPTEKKTFSDGSDAYVLYEISLDKWFNFGSDKQYKTWADLDLNDDGYVGYMDALCHVYKKVGTSVNDFQTDNWATDINGSESTAALSEFWSNPLTSTAHPQCLVSGSVFAGKFVSPFYKSDGKRTLELQLIDKDGKILKTWNVQIPSSELNTSGATESATAVTSSTPETQSCYSIYRNHMYSLGSKGLSVGGDGDPGDPVVPKPEPDPDPTPDPDDVDNPSDLSKGQDLTVQVNDRWEIIHHMEID